MRMVGFYPYDGSYSKPTISLPKGYVFDGKQTIPTYGLNTFNYNGTGRFGEISDNYPTNVNDGESSFKPKAWYGGACAYDSIIKVRKTN